MSLRYNFPRWVSESPCVLCRADRILASYLFGSTFSSSGIEVLLVAPVCLQDQSFDAQRRFGSFRAFQHPRPLPLAPSPKPPPSIAWGQKRYFIEMSLLHYWSKLVKLSPLGERSKTKRPKSISPILPPPSPTTAQQCLNTSGDKNNLQKWSRNYIMNCPNTRHIVGFLVNQIFLRKLHEFFWLHQRQQNRFFTSNNRAPKSHAGICKETRLSQVAGAGARLSRWQQRAQADPHLDPLLWGH